MDKLDEWMTRTFKQEKVPHPQHSQKHHEKKDAYSGEKPRQKTGGQYRNPQRHNYKKPFQARKSQGNLKPANKKKDGRMHVPSIASKQSPILKNKLKIIPLGGLNEIGKNMMALEYENDIIIIDMGLEFPDEDLLGIDYVIPDTTYLEENRKKIRGVILTHGHLDHIGGIPYILPKLDFPPIYATKLTLGFIQKRAEEFKQEKIIKFREIHPREPLRLGRFLLNFFRVAHSIPDAVGVVIDTPVGKFVNPGDFKFDDQPVRSEAKEDLQVLRSLGHQNVTGLFCDSTNALEEGHSMPEKQVGAILEDIIKNAKGRVIIATFSSQIDRLQQIIDAAKKHGRKVFISGKSLRSNTQIAIKLGFLRFSENLLNDIKTYKNFPDNKTLILSTGSQGEAVSALTRMANKEHPHVKVKKGDTIILSSSPIIGNERAIYTVINNLSILGAKVIHGQIMDIHTSGHAKREELKQMINLIRPKYLIPVHGEYYMRQTLADMANKECGIPEERIIMIQNGDILIAEQNKLYVAKEKIDTKYILIDGSGEGKLGSQVQVDREIMSQNGTLVILIHINKKNKSLRKAPDIVSRGFVYMHETEEVIEEIIRIAGDAYRKIHQKNPGASRKDIKIYIKQTIDKYTRAKLERRPLIIPLIIEN